MNTLIRILVCTSFLVVGFAQADSSGIDVRLKKIEKRLSRLENLSVSPSHASTSYICSVLCFTGPENRPVIFFGNVNAESSNLLDAFTQVRDECYDRSRRFSYPYIQSKSGYIRATPLNACQKLN